MTKIVFICDSDLHFNPQIRVEKENHVEKIKAQNDNPSIILLIGDLTDTGSDGKKILGCIPISGKHKELQGLKTDFIKPLEDSGFSVYSCMGNHDDYTYFPYIYKPIEKFIKEKHGNLCYSFIKDNLKFICLSKCPTESNLTYLKTQLSNNSPLQPTVLFFHYNLIGKWSDWWKESEKEDFYQAIKEYNIILIATGHIHSTSQYEWKNYKVITCGGSQMIKCTYDDIQKILTTEFI